MKDKMSKSTPLTHFSRHASVEQKQAVRNKVIHNAIARQKRVLDQAKELNC